MELTKVTMNLTSMDITNATTVLNRTHARSKAQAVGTALAIAAALIGEEGSEIFVKRKDGSTQQLLIPSVAG
jgi:multisubunit Na+/H+ antiporter MnhG subunit